MLIKGVGPGWGDAVKKDQFDHEQRGEEYDIGAKMIALVGGLKVDMDA